MELDGRGDVVEGAARLESIQGTISRNRGAIAGEARADIDQALALYAQAAQVASTARVLVPELRIATALTSASGR